MSQASVETMYQLSVFLLIPVGIALMAWWAVKYAYPRVVNRGARVVGTRTLVYMAPGLAALLLFSAPAFYFGSLRKQADYCRELIKANDITRATVSKLEGRCDGIDLDELLGEVEPKRP